MQWLDAYGRPVDIGALKTPQLDEKADDSGVAVMMRRPSVMHPAAGLTPNRLANILRFSIDGDPDLYLALAEDMEERHEHYSAVLSVRKRQVAGLPLSVEAAGEDKQSQEHAELVRSETNRDGFQDELIDILDAIGKGFSGTQINWDTSASQWRIAGLNWRDPRYFVFDKTNGQTPLLRNLSGAGEPLQPYGWIFHAAKMKSGLTIRGGLARGAAWAFMFRSFTLKDWAVFSEAYGQPIRLGKFGPDAKEADKDMLMQAVASVASDYAAIVPESMAIEFIKADIAGSIDLYERRADWLDRQISKLVLGQTGTTDAIAGGHAVGKIHEQVREDIEMADARQLANTLNRDLVRPLIVLNFGPQKAYPKIKLERPDSVDVSALVKNVVSLVPFGFRVSASVLRDRLGLPDPAADDELLIVPAPQITGHIDADIKPETKAALSSLSRLASAALKQVPANNPLEASASEAEWQEQISPAIAGLEAKIAMATTLADVRVIIDEAKATLNVEALTELLARLSFGARISGEAGEDLT